MGAAIDRIVKRVPSMAVGGMVTAVTVLAWGKFYQGVPVAIAEVSTERMPGEASAAGECAPSEIPDLSSLVGPSQPQLPPSVDGDELEEPVPDCSSAYPKLRVCSQLPHRYIYGSQQEALDDLKDERGNWSLRIQTRRTATSGPCPEVGDHYNVREPRSQRDYPASIVCCPCCDDDDLGAPTEDRLCGIVYKQDCDNRRRASDASCVD